MCGNSCGPSSLLFTFRIWWRRWVSRTGNCSMSCRLWSSVIGRISKTETTSDVCGPGNCRLAGVFFGALCGVVGGGGGPVARDRTGEPQIFVERAQLPVCTASLSFLGVAGRDAVLHVSVVLADATHCTPRGFRHPPA